MVAIDIRTGRDQCKSRRLSLELAGLKTVSGTTKSPDEIVEPSVIIDYNLMKGEE